MNYSLSNIVTDLIRNTAYSSEYSIATEVGCNQSTIHRIKKGEFKNPSYKIAKSLIDLHARAERIEKVDACSRV